MSHHIYNKIRYQKVEFINMHVLFLIYSSKSWCNVLVSYKKFNLKYLYKDQCIYIYLYIYVYYYYFSGKHLLEIIVVEMF